MIHNNASSTKEAYHLLSSYNAWFVQISLQIQR